MACRFLQAKWYDLEAKMGAGSINFAKVISAITQYGATKFDYDEVCVSCILIFRNFNQLYYNTSLSILQLKSLVHRFGDGPGMRTLNMTLKSVAANVEWVAHSHNAIFNWVESHETIARRR